jgi:DNA-directed RNA polymerase specialized sigma24 family protein
VGVSGADWEPPSGAVLAAALGRGETAGLLAAHDAYGPDLIGYAEFLLATRPAAAGVHLGVHLGDHLGDEAAAAVLDALLAATGAVADLSNPDRLRAWLLALTRNECLRRRPGPGGPSASEAAELGRRGLGPVDVASLLGFAPAALPSRLPAVETVPAWLRGELAAASGAEGADRRAELTRRARPFEADGFPVPLDRRRLSGKVLAWSAAVVVLIAVGLLIALPTHGSAGTAIEAGPVLAAVSEAPEGAPAEAADAPLPTLADAPFGSTTPAPPVTTTLAPPPATSAPPAATTSAAPTAQPPARPDAQTADRASRGGLSLSWSPAPGLACTGSWTAQLRVDTGGVTVSQVVAVGRNGARADLHQDGDGWSGQLSGLPTNRSVTVTVFAQGPVRPASARLSSNC